MTDVENAPVPCKATVGPAWLGPLLSFLKKSGRFCGLKEHSFLCDDNFSNCATNRHPDLRKGQATFKK